MRALKLGLLGLLLMTFTLLALDVVDFCSVGEDGAVSWAPKVRTVAIRRYGIAAWNAGCDAIAPQSEPHAASAGARPARAH